MAGVAGPRGDLLEVVDYRRRVFDMYQLARDDALPVDVRWQHFRMTRDTLFAEHPQSALTDEQRRSFDGLRYFAYEPGLRFSLPVDYEVGPEVFEVALRADGRLRLRRIGRLDFEIDGIAVRLYLYWLEGYGGGLFLPFRDATNGHGTFGGGRYLLDTRKGADLGTVDGRLIVDFNFAYNPSCAYNDVWHCPLPPVENWLQVPIRAGERSFRAAGPEGPDPTALPKPSHGG